MTVGICAQAVPPTPDFGLDNDQACWLPPSGVLFAEFSKTMY